MPLDEKRNILLRMNQEQLELLVQKELQIDSEISEQGQNTQNLFETNAQNQNKQANQDDFLPSNFFFDVKDDPDALMKMLELDRQKEMARAEQSKHQDSENLENPQKPDQDQISNSQNSSD